MPRTLDETNRKIIAAIRSIRREHAACSSGEVARQIGLSKNSVAKRVRKLQDDGVVSFTRLEGSLRVTPRTRKRPAE